MYSMWTTLKRNWLYGLYVMSQIFGESKSNFALLKKQWLAGWKISVKNENMKTLPTVCPTVDIEKRSEEPKNRRARIKICWGGGGAGRLVPDYKRLPTKIGILQLEYDRKILFAYRRQSFSHNRILLMCGVSSLCLRLHQDTAL